MPKSTEAYRDDLAYIHDTGFGFFATNAAPVVIDILQRRGIAAGRIIDLGCGSGILAEALAAAGYDVLGIDIAPSMLALARQRVPTGEFREGSLLTAELPPCVAVTAIGECFNYLFDRRNTVSALPRLFRRVRAALRPGGLFLFDIAEPGRVPGPGPQRIWREGQDWAVLVHAEEDDRGVLSREIISFRRVGDLYRRDREVHCLRLLRRADLREQLRATGFQVRLLSGYGPYRFPRGLIGFQATPRPRGY